MKIYTKSGDKGETSLLGGKRVSKSDIRIQTYGTIDELNSNLGLVKDQPVNQRRNELLHSIQETLFSIGSILAQDENSKSDKLPKLTLSDVEKLEIEIDEMEKKLPDLKNFILPGGNQSVSFCHIARSICRRAERWVIQLKENQEVDELIIKYLNRLSDFLFVLARTNAKELGVRESFWKPGI